MPNPRGELPLDACPFCGGEAITFNDPIYGPQVACSKPRCGGHEVRLPPAKWNTRAESASAPLEPITCPCGLIIKPIGNVVPVLQGTSRQLVDNPPKLVADHKRAYGTATLVADIEAMGLVDVESGKRGNDTAEQNLARAYLELHQQGASAPLRGGA